MAQSVGKANYSASSARAKSRKSSLIDQVRMKQLMQQDVNAISASIADSGYRADLDLYASRLNDAELVAADHEVLRTEILPEENSNNRKWLDIATRSKSLPEAIALMGSSPWGKTLSKLPEGSTLQEMEDALDRAYYADALKSVSLPGSDFTLMRYLRSEIDHKNVINILRSIRQGVDQEKIIQIMIPGGRSISKDVLRAMTRETTGSGVVETLTKKSPGFDSEGLIEAIEASEGGSLDPVIQLLAKKRDALLYSMSHRSPVSVLPVVHYIESKTHEVQNLRLLVRGKAAGLSNEVIEEHMR